MPQVKQNSIFKPLTIKKMKNKHPLVQKLEDNSFFKIYLQTEIRNSFDSYLSQDQLKKIDKKKVIKQYDNNSKITPKNWEQNKDTFFEQRMEMYEKSYTLAEKIKLEIGIIEKIPINNMDYQILKERYNTYLKTLPNSMCINENRTKTVITEIFANIDKKGWEYAFSSKQDYNVFINLLTDFFEYKAYTLSETIIQLKRGCKTKVAKALGKIHKELSNENKLSTDNKYFKLIKILNHFEKEKEGDLYKAVTR